MSTTYEVDIALPPTTVDALKNGGYALYGFKAVKSAVAGGAPLVWFKTLSFLSTTKVIWQEQYQAYISTDQIISNGQINASAACDIDLKQTAYVTQTGTITPATGGTDNAISILNQGSMPWTAGISQMNNGAAQPMCAIPLYGNMMDVIAPIEKVLLMFASNTVNTGTVIYNSISQGCFIDLTSSQNRQVNFDINQGWSWGSGTWATSVAPNAELVPLLIT
jgi:hypothetical protein